MNSPGVEFQGFVICVVSLFELLDLHPVKSEGIPCIGIPFLEVESVLNVRFCKLEAIARLPGIEFTCQMHICR